MMRFQMSAECCEVFARTDVRGETIADSRSYLVEGIRETKKGRKIYNYNVFRKQFNEMFIFSAW